MSKFAGLPEKKKKKKHQSNQQNIQAEMFTSYGIEAFNAEDYASALHFYLQAHELSPLNEQIIWNLADTHTALGDLNNASLFWLKLCSINIRKVDPYLRLATYQIENQLLEDAKKHINKALNLEGKNPEALYLTAKLEHLNGNHEEAINILKRIEIKQISQRVEYLICELLSDFALYTKKEQQPELDQLIKEFIFKILQNSNFPEIITSMMINRNYASYPEEKYSFLQKALSYQPNSIQLHKQKAFASNYLVNLSAQDVFEIHQQAAHVIAQNYPEQKQIWKNKKNKSKILHVGYVSDDFRIHVIFQFMLGIFKYHNKKKVKIFAYSSTAKRDRCNAAFQAYAHQWRDIHGWTPQNVRNQIINDKIDILVDLMGYSSNTLLEIFSIRAAPIQMTWLGYLNTTGLSNMDYRITDPVADPLKPNASFHSEKLAYLPVQWGYNFPNFSLKIEPHIKSSKEEVALGSFNNYSKINEVVLDCWQKILNQLPSAQLFIMGIENEQEKPLIIQFFEKHGIDSQRLKLYSRILMPEYFQLFNQIDIALDTWPYSGGATTCNALWMGVPVITFLSDRLFSRSAASILTCVQCEELIAKDAEDYIAKAVELGSDIPRCRAYKETLRAKIESSPLMSLQKFTADLEALYRKAWERYCDDLPPEHIFR